MLQDTHEIDSDMENKIYIGFKLFTAEERIAIILCIQIKGHNAYAVIEIIALKINSIANINKIIKDSTILGALFL